MNAIKEDYVSFEIAKFLKEKGFDEPFFFYYRTDDEVKNIHHAPVLKPLSYYQKCIDDEVVNAPTIQMAMKWLRETHGIDIIIEISDPSVKDRKYYCMIWDGNNNSYILDLFNSYEEACEAAIKYVLENLI